MVSLPRYFKFFYDLKKIGFEIKYIKGNESFSFIKNDIELLRFSFRRNKRFQLTKIYLQIYFFSINICDSKL